MKDKWEKMKVSKFSGIFVILTVFIFSATPCIASEKNTPAQEQIEYSKQLKKWEEDYNKDQAERQKAIEEYKKQQEERRRQQEEYGKRYENLLERNEKTLDKTEEQQKRFDQILSVWENQQKQHQEYLNSLRKN